MKETKMPCDVEIPSLYNICQKKGSFLEQNMNLGVNPLWSHGYYFPPQLKVGNWSCLASKIIKTTMTWPWLQSHLQHPASSWSGLAPRSSQTPWSHSSKCLQSHHYHHPQNDGSTCIIEFAGFEDESQLFSFVHPADTTVRREVERCPVFQPPELLTCFWALTEASLFAEIFQ